MSVEAVGRRRHSRGAHLVLHLREWAMATPSIAPLRTPHRTASESLAAVDNEAPLRWQRTLHLAPRDGLGIGRRAAFFALLCWLPIAVWAMLRGSFLAATVGEPLLQHYGVHVRCLLAIPLLILGERTLHAAGRRQCSQFLRSGVVDDVTRPRFEAAVQQVRRWRESSVPWLVVIGC